jgi:WD40 repeat protein
VLEPIQEDAESAYTVVFPGATAELEVSLVEIRGKKGIDLAVLRIAQADSEGMPSPVDLWPDDRLPDRVAAFGFPGAERSPEGVWREFTVSGQTTTRLGQLRWDEEVGTFPGHSGGPVVDLVTQALVGVLVAGSEDGHFDRFITLTQVAEAWPALKRPWRYAGDGAKTHFSRRAYGQRLRAQGGDFFRGRQVALRAIADWLERKQPGRPLVIIGQPGSGKSAVLGRAAMNGESSGGRGLVYHARSATVEHFLNAVAGFLGLATPENTDEMVEQIAGMPATADFTIMIDALDEAQSLSDSQLISECLAELARLPNFHIVVATRPMAAGNRFAPSTLLARLMVSGASAPNLIDVDVEPYRDREAIREFAEAMLSQLNATNPGPADCAWEAYRLRKELRIGLSKAIAERSDTNFLVAAITAMALATQDQVVDYKDPSFDIASIPSNLGEALEKYYTSLDRMTRQKVMSILAALSYARGSGVSDVRWLRFANQLGYDVNRLDIDSFRSSPGADYLLQSEAEVGDPAVRLFHQALIDQLRSGRPESDEKKIYESLTLDVAAAGGWGNADSYLVSHMADHALACGQLSALLDSAGFIGAASIPPLISALSAQDPLACSELGQLILQEGLRLRDLKAQERVWLLAISAMHAGQPAIRDQLLSDARPMLFPEWAHALGGYYQKFNGHPGSIQALAIGRLGRSDVVVSGGTDATIRVWAHQGNKQLDPFEGHSGPVTALEIGIVDGEDVVVSGGADKTVRLWNHDGSPVGAPFLGHTQPVRSVQIINFEDSYEAIVSVAPKGEIIVWNPEGLVLRKFPIDVALVATGNIEGKPVIVGVGYYSLTIFSPIEGYLHSVPVKPSVKTSLAIGRLRAGDVVVGALKDGSVEIWRADGTTARSPLVGLDGAANSIAVGRLGATTAITAAARNSSLVVWDFRGSVLAEPWSGHPATANVVAMGRLRGRDVVACGGDDHTIRVWDHRSLLGRARTNKREHISALATATVGDDLHLVTVSGTNVESWDVNGMPVSRTVLPSPKGASVISKGRLSRGEAIVSAGTDRRIYIWYMNGDGTVESIGSHRKKVTALAVGRFEDRAVIASAARDMSIRIWDEEGQELARINAFGKRGPREMMFGRFGGRDSLVVLGDDHDVRVWDLLDERWAHQSPTPGLPQATCMIVFTLDGHDIVALGGSDGKIRTWQAGQEYFRATQDQHSAKINALSLLNEQGSSVLASLGADSVLRVWSDMGSSEIFPLTEPATLMSKSDGVIILASGPALSMLKYEPRADADAALAGSGEFAFTSTVMLASPSSPTTPKAHAAFQGSENSLMDYAYSLYAEGDAGAALVQLLPRAGKSVNVLQRASDIAFASGRVDLMQAVLTPLKDPRVRGQMRVQARLFAIAVSIGELDVAREAAAAIGTDVFDAMLGLTYLFERARGQEWDLYRESAASLSAGEFGADFNFAHFIAEVAAMRLLAVCRHDSVGDSFFLYRDALTAEFWRMFGSGVAPRLLRLVSDFTDSATDPVMFPYQVLSVYEVLRAADLADDVLRDQLIGAIARELRAKPPKIRKDFAAWRGYSDLAAAVLDRNADIRA